MTQEMKMFAEVREWRRIAMEKIHADLAKRKIGASGALKDSIVINIIYGADTVEGVQFIFNAYGKFVDMGVGRGWKIGSRKATFEANRGKNKEDQIKPRMPKKFYTKTIFHEGHRLHEILIKRFGIQAMAVLETTIPANTKIEL